MKNPVIKHQNTAQSSKNSVAIQKMDNDAVSSSHSAIMWRIVYATVG
jgi:hypothetical protein